MIFDNKMDVVKINPDLRKQQDDRVIQLACRVIQKGGVVIHPTDTCYGMAADPTNKKALQAVYDVKQRNEKLFNMIVPDLKEFRKYGTYYPIVKKIIDKYSDYQFSFVVPRTNKLPLFFRPETDTVSIQIPKLVFSRQLLKNINIPLVATSANLSGQKPCYDARKLLMQFKKEKKFNFPVLVLDGGRIPEKKPSSVIKIEEGSRFEILREGDAGRIKL